jgi:hypothetical protein
MIAFCVLRLVSSLMEVDWCYVVVPWCNMKYPDDGFSRNLWNVGQLRRDCTAQYRESLVAFVEWRESLAWPDVKFPLYTLYSVPLNVEPAAIACRSKRTAKKRTMVAKCWAWVTWDTLCCGTDDRGGLPARDTDFSDPTVVSSAVSDPVGIGDSCLGGKTAREWSSLLT